MVQGGIEANYYTNRWFAGDAYLTQIDEEINFNWGTDMLIDDIATNYVSITWEGFLTVPATDSYIFTLHANDGVRLTINQ